MSTDVESTARSEFARVVGDLDAAELDLGADMVADYGLSSMNKVLFMMSMCDRVGVSLATFTEADLAVQRTLQDVVSALTERRASADGVAS